MARFDVHLVEGEYYMDVQSNLLDTLRTRLVVPLVPSDAPVIVMRKLNPQFDVNGRQMIMATQLMVAVPSRSLGRPITSLDRHYDQIKAALDMIFLGF